MDRIALTTKAKNRLFRTLSTAVNLGQCSPAYAADKYARVVAAAERRKQDIKLSAFLALAGIR